MERQANQDIDQLERLVTLPVRPEAVWFGTVPRGKASAAPGPTDWTLVAVMRFDPSRLASFIASAGLREMSPARIRRSEVPTWLPAEVAASLSPLDDTYLEVRGRRFAAEPFAPRPGTSSDAASVGSIFVLEGGRFVLLRRSL